MNDRNPELEERLRTALLARSEEIEPGNDSYVRLQQRVAAGQPANSGRRISIPPRYFAAAAVLLVAVASAAALVGQQRRSSVEAVGPTSSAPTTVVEQTTITTTPEAPAEINVVSTTVPPREYVPAPVAGPREETREAAALAFLELLEVDHAGIEVDGLHVGVRTFTEDREIGEVVVTLDLIEAEIRKGTMGYSVVRATSSSILITSPAVGSENTLSPLVVAGEGTGFEGTLGVTLVSSSDGSVLASSFAAAGNNGEMAPFTANLEVSGAERGWIVVASEGGADNVLAAFSAIPVSFVVGGNPIEYVVANIPADDVAGGLHVRDFPGTEDSQVLVTLPAGTAGIQRLGRIPAVVEDQVWWEITVELEGQTHRGWVNSRFLTDPAAAQPGDDAAAMPTDDELAAMAKIFLIAGSDRDVSALGQLRWSEQVEVGWIGRPGLFTSEVVRSDEFWTGPQEWNMPAELGEPQVLLSLLSLLELPDPTAPDVAFEADADPISPYGADQAALGDRFDDARTITIFDQTPDTPWRHTTLVVRPTADGAEIVAVLLTVWVP